MRHILLILPLICNNLVTVFFFKKFVLTLPEFTLSCLLPSLLRKEFIIAMTSGCLSVVLYLFILHRMELSRMMPLTAALLTVASSMAGIFYFGEPATPTKLAGLTAVTVGIILSSL